MPQPVAPAERTLFPWRPWDVVLALVGAVGAAVLIALALGAAVPPVMANLSSEVSEGQTVVPIGDGRAEVVVPAGWVVQRSGGAVTALTPDGVLSARLDLVSGDPRSIVEDALDGAGVLREETLASGREIVHADAAADLLYAAIPIDATTAVRVVAETLEGHAIAEYRAALAGLLDGVRADGGAS